MKDLPILAVKDGRVVATSLQVAEKFGKRHKNVIQAIESLECSREFFRLNFQPIEIEVKVGFGIRKDLAYEMTRDGFAFLAMGFTGKPAAAWKEKYIAAFNAMEAGLHQALTRERDALRGQLVETQQRLIKEMRRRPAKLKPRWTRWTAEEDARLLALRAEGLGYYRIGHQLKRTHDSVAHRFRRLAEAQAQGGAA